MKEDSTSNKKLIVFDLDGTLAPSKSFADAEMIRLLSDLLAQKFVAIIGGGRYSQFEEQVINYLPAEVKLLEKLFLFPTCSTVFYRYGVGGWEKVYSNELSEDERQQIFKAFEETFLEVGYVSPVQVYGEVIEDRGTQITFSALGQDVVKVLGPEEGIKQKELWGALPWREKIASALESRLTNLEVRRGGITSIDVTKKGIDKAYGLKQIVEHLQIPIEKMLFIGDAIFPGGNDYAVISTGVDYIKVSDSEETKKVIRKILAGD